MHSLIQRLMLWSIFLFLYCPPELVAQKMVILPSDGSSSQASVPQDGLRYQRQYYLITPAEMAASDIVNGNNLNALGFTLATAQDNVTEEVTYTFPNAPHESNSESGSTQSTLAFPGLPAGSEIISATLNLSNIEAFDPSWKSEFRVSLSGHYTLGEFSVSNDDNPGTINSHSEALANFPITGGNINLVLRESFNDSSVNPDATMQSASITLVYKVHGLLKLYLKNTTDTERAVDATWTEVSSTTTSVDINGLDPGNYEWRVKEGNSGSSSPFSDILAFSTAKPTECNQPENLSTTSIGPSAATFNWTAPLSNGFTAYKVEYKNITESTWSLAANTTSTSFTQSGLSANTTYQWRISTTCGTESSSENGSIFTTTDNFCNSVGGSASGGATGLDTTFTVQWNAATGATRYEVRYRREGTSSFTTLSSFSTALTITGLETGTTYEWQVRAVCDDSGTIRKGVFSSVSTFATSTPPTLYPPAELKTNVKNDTDVGLSWNAVSGATEYTIQYRIKESVSWTSINPDVDMTLVHNDFFEIPDVVGPYSIPFSSSFAYTGGGLYVAWEYTRADGVLADLNTALTNSTGILVEKDPSDTTKVIKSFFSFGTESEVSTTAHRELLLSTFFRPKTHVESSDRVDIAEVSVIYALGHHAISFANPSPVSALVKNNSGSSKSFDVSLTIKDEDGNTVAGPFTQNISVNGNASQLVSFTNWTPTIAGNYTIEVSIPQATGENALKNNSSTYPQVVNPYILGYDDSSPAVTSAGFGTGSGLLLNRHTMDGCGRINAAQVYLAFSSSDQEVYAVVLDAGGSELDRSASFIPTELDVNAYHTFYFPNTPLISSGADYYIGLAQTASTDAYNPVGVQWKQRT